MHTAGLWHRERLHSASGGQAVKVHPAGKLKKVKPDKVWPDFGHGGYLQPRGFQNK